MTPEIKAALKVFENGLDEWATKGTMQASGEHLSREVRRLMCKVSELEISMENLEHEFTCGRFDGC